MGGSSFENSGGQTCGVLKFDRSLDWSSLVTHLNKSKSKSWEEKEACCLRFVVHKQRQLFEAAQCLALYRNDSYNICEIQLFSDEPTINTISSSSLDQ